MATFGTVPFQRRKDGWFGNVSMSSTRCPISIWSAGGVQREDAVLDWEPLVITQPLSEALLA